MSWGRSLSLPLVAVAMLAAVLTGQEPATDLTPKSRKRAAAPAGRLDGELRRLLTERRDTAAEGLRLAQANYDRQTTSFSELLMALNRYHRARLELCETPAERVDVLREMLRTAQDLETKAQTFARLDVTGNRQDAAAARFHRLDLEVELWRATREPDAPLQR
jgi:hypothetical protein